jgi:TetR/AcrR family transcriptional regulator, tetracycline repressor protein
MNQSRRPGPKRGLSVDQVVEEAFALLVDGGVAGFSMRKLASALGVTTMALYTYFPSRDALIEHLADECLGRCPVATAALGSWSDRLRAHQIEVAAALARYQGLVHAIATGGGMNSANGRRNRADVLQLLRDAGFNDQQAGEAYGSLSMLLHGYLAMTADRRTSADLDRYTAAVDLMLAALADKLSADTRTGEVSS